MRMNDIGLLAIVLLAGLLIGVVGTLGAYNVVATRQAEAEQREKDEAIKRLEEERDQLQGQINDFAEAERSRGLVAEQPAVEAPARPTQTKRPAAAPAPRADAGSTGKREGVPAPREDRGNAKAGPGAKDGPDPAAAGFGPPHEYGNK